MDGMNEEFEWLSVGEVAKNEKVTPQTIYKRIKEGLYETIEKINDLKESLKKLSDSKDNAIVVHHNVWNDDYICEIEVDLDKYKDWCDNSMVKKVESLEKENKDLKMQVRMLHDEINHLENRNLFERIFNK